MEPEARGARVVSHPLPIVEFDEDVEARPVVLGGISFFKVESRHAADNLASLFLQGYVMQHVWPIKPAHKMPHILRVRNDPGPGGIIVSALVGEVIKNLLDASNL